MSDDNSGLDWDVLSLSGVEFTAVQAAESVAYNQQYKDYVELDDLIQEALIIMASMGPDAREAVDGGDEITLGAIKYRIEMDLIDKVRTLRRRGMRNQSFDERYAEGENYRPRVTTTVRQEVGAYTEELVETLLPAVWDETYCYGIRVENAPDDDMPRGSTNKATGNALSAHIADIKGAWHRADLTVKERRALILRYGLDWGHREIAFNQECPRQTITERLRRAVSKLLHAINAGVDLGVMPEGDPDECATDNDDEEEDQ